MDSKKLFSHSVEVMKSKEPSLTYLECIKNLIDSMNYLSLSKGYNGVLDYNTVPDLLDSVLLSKLEKEQCLLGEVKGELKNKRKLF